jgi:hypothetical protein
MSFVPSHIQAFNKLIIGHPKKLPTLIFGPPAGGKSILMGEISIDFLTDFNCLYIDAEGGLDKMFAFWLPIWERKLGKPIQIIRIDTPGAKHIPASGAILILEARHIHTVLQAHGFKTDLTISESGKIDLKLVGSCHNVIEEAVSKCNVGLLVYDSLTNPLKTTFVGGRVNFPGRADAVNMWMSGLIKIADNYDIVVYGTSHRSVDPTNPYAKPHAVGGSTLLYNFKCTMYLDPSKYAQYKNRRTLWIERFFNVEPWKRSERLNLSDTGYQDDDRPVEAPAKNGKNSKKENGNGGEHNAEQQPQQQ